MNSATGGPQFAAVKLSLLVTALLLTAVPAVAQSPATPQPPATPAPSLLTDQDIEQFLLHARVISSHLVGKGVTGSERVTLREGSLTHDAHVQTIDEQLSEGPGAGGRTEPNFRDSWTYNVAAYRLDRLIGLNLVPVSVERRWSTRSAAFTWWVDDVMMDEGERLTRKLTAPDVETWNQEMQLLRLFDQLIYNVDRNAGHVLITKGWQVWAIDHTRAFRLYAQLKSPGQITRCDRALLERLRQLDQQTLTRAMGKSFFRYEISALLSRRDAIVALIERAGPSALFDRSGK